MHFIFLLFCLSGWGVHFGITPSFPSRRDPSSSNVADGDAQSSVSFFQHRHVRIDATCPSLFRPSRDSESLCEMEPPEMGRLLASVPRVRATHFGSAPICIKQSINLMRLFYLVSFFASWADRAAVMKWQLTMQLPVNLSSTESYNISYLHCNHLSST